MKHALMFAALAACGGNTTPPAVPDAAVDQPQQPASFEPKCEDVPQPSGAFATADAFGEIVPGTLAGWDPTGRWFLTGVRMGVSSIHLARSGANVILDRNPERTATLDDNALFERFTFDGTGSFARRITNRLEDGSLRFDRAICDGETCRVCTARVIRATFPEGEVESDKLPLVGQLYGANWEPTYSLNVRVVGNLAYLIRLDGLYIIDVSNPALPQQLGHYRSANPDSYSNDLKIVDGPGGRRFAIIADTPVDVVDVTNTAAPFLVTNILEGAHTVFTETRDGKTLAYFGNYDASCPVWDVTNPAQPQRVGKYQSDGNLVHDLSVADSIAYLNAWDAGLLVVDFNTPNAPVLRGQWEDTPTDTSHSNWTTRVGGRHLAIHGEETYGAHLDVVDLDAASPTFMQPIGTYKTRDWVSIHNIMAFGSKAYFTHYQDGVRVVDLSDPTAPRLVGYHNTWDPQADYTTSQFFDGAVGLDVDLARKLIFVADGRGLLILRDDT